MNIDIREILIPQSLPPLIDYLITIVQCGIASRTGRDIGHWSLHRDYGLRGLGNTVPHEFGVFEALSAYDFLFF